jgi:hypothetical protein
MEHLNHLVWVWFLGWQLCVASAGITVFHTWLGAAKTVARSVMLEVRFHIISILKGKFASKFFDECSQKSR